MEEMQENLLELVISGIGAAVLGLVGFVWNISHRVNSHQRQIEATQEMQRQEFQQIRKDLDYIVQKLDKESDKIYALVRKENNK